MHHQLRQERPPSLEEFTAWNIASLAAGVALMSLALLLFEISLTRLFSVVLNYHFVFLAVSVALMGLGVGGCVGQFLVRCAHGAKAGALLIFAGLTATALPLVTFMMVSPAWGGSWPIYALLAALPFVSAGAMSALLYQRFASASGLLYGLDLAGASGGCALSVVMLWRVDAVSTMLTSAGAALLGTAALAFGLRRPLAATSWGMATVLVGAGVAVIVRFAPLDVPVAAPYDFSTKTMFAALNDHVAPARILETRWTPLGRTDLVQYPDPSVRAIFTDAGAGTLMLRFDGDWDKLEPLRRDTGFLPFSISPRERVLVIGPGGGKDVLLALMGGAQDITAVEINPATVAMVREHGTFNGRIYDRPNVHVIVAEGRSFVRRSREHFDLIYLSLVFTQAVEAIGYSLAENFIYTTEAFQDYLSHLRPGGWLAMVLHDDASLSKVLMTGLVVLQRRGVSYPDLRSRLAVIRLPNRPEDDPRTTRQPLLLFKNEPFTNNEATALARLSATRGLDALFIPGVVERGLVPLLLSSPAALAEFRARAPYNVHPATDDSPFFYNTELGVPRALWGLVWGTLLAAGVLFALSLATTRPLASESLGKPILLTSYFALIGIGFALVEIALLEKLVLFLGWPTLALAVGLAAFLAAGAVGSLLMQRWHATQVVPRARLAALFGAVVLLAHAVALPTVTQASLSFSQSTRVFLAIMLVAPVGIPLGVLFPTGVRLAGSLYSGSLPSLWAINGVASVLGSALAIVLALRMGFTAALVIGSCVYGIVAVLARGLSTVPRDSGSSHYLV